MPKVGSEPFRIKGKETRFDLMYSKKEGFYYKGFPLDVYNLTDTHAYYNTEASLKSATDMALFKYHKIISESKRVILYTISAPVGKVMNRTDYGRYEGFKSELGNIAKKIGRAGNHYDNSFGFTMSWRTVLREESNGVTYYDAKTLENMPDAPRRRTHKTQEEFEIEWSQEREDFFVALDSKMDKLFMQVVAFFSKPEEELLLLMENHKSTKLLS